MGIDYVVTYGAWSASRRSKLEELRTKVNAFGEQFRDVRNRSLSHNDLASVVAGATLGEFPKGDYEKYFHTRQEFANLVHAEVVGGPFTFNHLVKNDVAVFLAALQP